MANHCVDCEFCGQDRRAVGPNCCEKRREADRKQHFDNLHQAELDAIYLRKFGLTPCSDALGYQTKLSARDVVEVLKKLEKGSLQRT